MHKRNDMKKLGFLLAALFMLQIGYGQELSGVVNFNGRSAEKLFNASREWFALKYQSNKDQVKLADTDTKVFIVNGERRATVLIKNLGVKIRMNFTLKLEFKDGRFKYDFQNVEYREVITAHTLDIEAFKECSTVDGIVEYYKRNGIPKFLEGNKEDEAKRNQENYRIVTTMPSDIIDDLTSFLKNRKNENW